jgi:hypothetical protein
MIWLLFHSNTLSKFVLPIASGGQNNNANRLSMDRRPSNNDLNINQCFQKNFQSLMSDPKTVRY